MLSNYSLKLIFKKESDAFLMMVSIYIKKATCCIIYEIWKHNEYLLSNFKTI